MWSLHLRRRIDGWIKISGILLGDKLTGQQKAGKTCMIHGGMNRGNGREWLEGKTETPAAHSLIFRPKSE